MNFKCTLEMLQPELWLVVSMRKCSESRKSFTADTRFDFFVFLFQCIGLFVCSAFLFQNPTSHPLQLSLLEEPGNQSKASRSVIIGCFSVHAGKWLGCA